MYTSVTVGHILTLFLAVSLVFSFGLHSIQIAHVHFGIESGHDHDTKNSQLGEYMHLADKKVFTIALFVFIAPWTFLSSVTSSRKILSLYLERRLRSCFRGLSLRWNTTFEYFIIYFRKGVLHSKVF